MGTTQLAFRCRHSGSYSSVYNGIKREIGAATLQKSGGEFKSEQTKQIASWSFADEVLALLQALTWMQWRRFCKETKWRILFWTSAQKQVIYIECLELIRDKRSMKMQQVRMKGISCRGSISMRAKFGLWCNFATSSGPIRISKLDLIMGLGRIL